MEHLAAGFWNTYKVKKPAREGRYLIALEDGQIQIGFWSGSRWVEGLRVFAWAHLCTTEGKDWV